MAYLHGVYTREIPTAVVPPTRLDAGLPVIFGTAPLHLSGELENVNKPILCYSYAEAVKALGYSDDWTKYTLCEFIYSQFMLHKVAPVVLINVLDPKKHIERVDATRYTFDADGKIDLGLDVIGDSLVVTSTDYAPAVAGEPGTPQVGSIYELDNDFIIAYDDDGKAILSIVPDGDLDGVTEVDIAFTKIDASAVTANDVIGGVNAKGENTGITLVEEVYPKFGIIPGLLAAPGWSDNPSVAGVLSAYSDNINGLFTAKCVVDIPTEICKAYSEVSEWKNRNNYVMANMIACWPMVKLGDKMFHISTQIIGVMNKTDADNGGGMPYISPSNKNLKADSAVLIDGAEVNLGLSQANYLNGQGIVTALNFIGGWRVWGNRTACYPANTDPKDAFIPITRMFAHLRNMFITTFWQKVDDPLNKRLIRAVVNSFNYVLNGLTAAEAILGGRIEFLSDENVVTDLMDGIVKFHVYMTPPPPAKEIHADFEFDVSYFDTLFEGV